MYSFANWWLMTCLPFCVGLFKKERTCFASYWLVLLKFLVRDNPLSAHMSALCFCEVMKNNIKHTIVCLAKRDNHSY